MKKMKIKLVYKLFFSYLFIVAMMIGLIYAINISMRQNIDDYFQKRTENVVDLLIEKFSEDLTSGNINIVELNQSIEAIPETSGMKIKYFNTDGKEVYEYEKKPQDKPPEYNLPKQFMSDNYIENEYDVNYQGEYLGKLVIGHYGRNNLNRNDISFINIVEKQYRFAIIFVVIMGLVFSLIVSRSITRPLKRVSKTAHEIRQGKLTSRVNIKTNTSEIVDLENAINYMADTLEKEDSLRKQMSSDMAHEIRTPLTTLRNFFEAFIDGVWEPNEIHMNKCYDEIMRMTELVDKLKDISALEESQLVIKDENFNLTEEIQNIVELFMPQFQKKEIDISMNLQNVQVYMDKNKINQMMTNLLSNAYRYSNEKGHVDITLSEKDERIIIVVKDRGIGITKEDLPYIFERFYRSDKSRSRDTGGMGVGLTIVKKIVDSYHGDIKVESELARGTAFIIEIPKVNRS